MIYMVYIYIHAHRTVESGNGLQILITFKVFRITFWGVIQPFWPSSADPHVKHGEDTIPKSWWITVDTPGHLNYAQKMPAAAGYEPIAGLLCVSCARCRRHRPSVFFEGRVSSRWYHPLIFMLMFGVLVTGDIISIYFPSTILWSIPWYPINNPYIIHHLTSCLPSESHGFSIEIPYIPLFPIISHIFSIKTHPTDGR